MQSEWSKLKEVAESATRAPMACRDYKVLGAWIIYRTDTEEEIFDTYYERDRDYLLAANPDMILRLLAQNEAMAAALEAFIEGADPDCGDPDCGECELYRPARAALGINNQTSKETVCIT